MVSVTCYCGKVFESSVARGHHLKGCATWRAMTPVQKKEHRERVKLLAVLRNHNPMKGRFKFCMQELLASTIIAKDA